MLLVLSRTRNSTLCTHTSPLFLVLPCETHIPSSLGADVDDAGAAGDGPGSYDVRGNVWHLDFCNPENNFDSSGWTLFNAIFGWTNSATIGTVLGYVFYWLAAMAVLVYMKYKEGRTKLFGYESAAGVRRRERAALRRGDSEAGGSNEKVSA